MRFSPSVGRCRSGRHTCSFRAQTEYTPARARATESSRTPNAPSGVGVALIENVAAVLDGLNLRRVALATSTAHGLYAKVGFDTVAAPDHWMERR